MSIDRHDSSHNPSQRDDIESLLYSLISLFMPLPWTEKKNAPSKTLKDAKEAFIANEVLPHYVSGKNG